MTHRTLSLGLASALAALCCACDMTQPAHSVSRPSASTVTAARPAPGDPEVPLPNKPDSLKFAVIGDNGNGDPAEYETARQMAAWHAKFDFPFVIMDGDNIYGSERPQDFKDKFESPYKALLDAGVKFYASLGNHDSREQRYYKLYNMDGQLYYTFKAPKQDVRFFAFESTYMDPDQLKWIENALKQSNDKWKICFFHHPLYSSARTHGSQLKLRAVLEPLFIEYNVSVVFNGHDHVYERIKPQNGIQYFVEGASGQLRDGDLRQGSPLTAKGFDTDRSFMLVEINGDTMNFITVSRTGAIVDSGVVPRRTLKPVQGAKTNGPPAPHQGTKAPRH
jgi:predicted phosphodiesterase